MSAPRAIVFDLDDTLYPERAYVHSGFAAVATMLGRRFPVPPDLTDRMRALFDTPDRPRVFNVIVEQLALPNGETLIADMIQTYRTHRPTIALYPDADAALTRLRDSAKLGLITDGHAAAQHAKIDALHLRPRLDALIVTDDWGRGFWKPHPRAFEEMSARLAVPPDRCTYVADNPAKDFVAPNVLGWHTIQIRRRDAPYAGGRPVRCGEPREIIELLDASRWFGV